MVVDTSALIAIVLQESVAPRPSRTIAAAPTRLVAAATLLEASIVALSRAQTAGARTLDGIIDSLSVTAVPVIVTQVALSRTALAVERGEPLLFIGNDFPRTNVDVAPY